MVRKVYELALNPTMLLKQFNILVKCERQNGVVLIECRDDQRQLGNTFTILVQQFRKHVRFFSIPLDCSQTRTRKIGLDKELVMILVEKCGIPCYLIVSSLEMSEFCGVNINLIKKEIVRILDEEEGKDGCHNVHQQGFPCDSGWSQCQHWHL